MMINIWKPLTIHLILNIAKQIPKQQNNKTISNKLHLLYEEVLNIFSIFFQTFVCFHLFFTDNERYKPHQLVSKRKKMESLPSLWLFRFTHILLIIWFSLKIGCYDLPKMWTLKLRKMSNFIKSYINYLH